MKKYLVTEAELYELGFEDWGDLEELPPDTKLLTRGEFFKLCEGLADVDYGWGDCISDVADRLFGSNIPKGDNK